MDKYWRVGNSFTAFRYVSKMMPDMYVVGMVVHTSSEGAEEQYEKMWDDMKKLIPEDYYDNYEMLKVVLLGYPQYIVFDTYEQGKAFCDFFYEHFKQNHWGYAALYVDGEFRYEST